MADERDIVERLEAWCTDYDGTPMVDGTTPLDGLHCDELREAAATITQLREERDAFKTACAMAEAETISLKNRVREVTGPFVKVFPTTYLRFVDDAAGAELFMDYLEPLTTGNFRAVAQLHHDVGGEP